MDHREKKLLRIKAYKLQNILGIWHQDAAQDQKPHFLTHVFQAGNLHDINLQLKCQLVPHDKRDSGKGAIWNDSPTTQFCGIRLLLPILTPCHQLSFAILDVRIAYIKGGNLLRCIHGFAKKLSLLSLRSLETVEMHKQTLWIGLLLDVGCGNW